ncbi:MAG: hypothetical protein Q8K58_10815 [Acidimicrobiales bacterium]|nr:hypothetical protein [Acidimicrobiales bacterium]
MTGPLEAAEAALAELLADEPPAAHGAPRWPLADFERLLRAPLADLAAAAGYDRTATRRWRTSGLLSDEAADRLAIAAGLHPVVVWSGWCL